jgi:hypothetical protein
MNSTAATLFDEALQALEPSARSKCSRIAELLPRIEEALRLGYKQAYVAKALAAAGIEVTAPVLSSYLRRLRRRQSHAAELAAVSTPPTAAISKAPDAPPATTTEAAHLRRTDEHRRPPSSANSVTPMVAIATADEEGNVGNSDRFMIAPGVYQDFKYGSHDPRRLDEIIGRAPDLRAWRQDGLEMAAQKKRQQAAAARAAASSHADPGVPAADDSATP